MQKFCCLKTDVYTLMGIPIKVNKSYPRIIPSKFHLRKSQNLVVTLLKSNIYVKCEIMKRLEFEPFPLHTTLALDKRAGF